MAKLILNNQPLVCPHCGQDDDFMEKNGLTICINCDNSFTNNELKIISRDQTIGITAWKRRFSRWISLHWGQNE